MAADAEFRMLLADALEALGFGGWRLRGQSKTTAKFLMGYSS